MRERIAIDGIQIFARIENAAEIAVHGIVAVDLHMVGIFGIGGTCAR